MPDIHNNDPVDKFKKEIENNSEDYTYEYDPVDISENRALAAACYIPLLFFLPLVIRPDSKFARFHANQGLILFLADAILGAARKGVGFIPFVPFVLEAGVSLVVFAYFLYGFVNALGGKAKELPFIGKFKLIR